MSSQDPLDAQFKIRVRKRDLEAIGKMANDGVTLPARTIPAGVSKTELVRLALGLDDSASGSVLDDVTSRLRGGDSKPTRGG